MAGELIVRGTLGRHELADELDAAPWRIGLVIEDAVGRAVVEAEAARDAGRKIVRADMR
jgi:hypothetical protein